MIAESSEMLSTIAGAAMGYPSGWWLVTTVVVPPPLLEHLHERVAGGDVVGTVVRLPGDGRCSLGARHGRRYGAEVFTLASEDRVHPPVDVGVGALDVVGDEIGHVLHVEVGTLP